MTPPDPRVRALVRSAAATVDEQLASVIGDVQAVIEAAIPALQADESATLLRASVRENVDTMTRALADGQPTDSIDAPAAAVDYARTLAQQDVPATLLIRAYRVGQARYLRRCMEELLSHTPGDHLEGLAALEMMENVSTYIDRVVEQVLTAFGEARDDWLRDRSAVQAMRVRDLLRNRPLDLGATEHALGYRLDQHHLGIVGWVDGPAPADGLERVRRVIGSVTRDVDRSATSLVVPADDTSAWAWIPSRQTVARSEVLHTATALNRPCPSP